jgi:hypothetical protein
MRSIDRTQYQQLNMILWDIHDKFIQPKVAFEMYEKRWNYIDDKKMSNDEKELIHKLIHEYGYSNFMPATSV